MSPEVNEPVNYERIAELVDDIANPRTRLFAVIDARKELHHRLRGLDIGEALKRLMLANLDNFTEGGGRSDQLNQLLAA